VKSPVRPPDCLLCIAFSYLGEKRGPDGLDVFDLGSLEDGLHLVGLGRMVLASGSSISVCREAHGDLDLIIREDKSRVGAREFSVRHCGCIGSLSDL
jgi:hypothetical protein